jgi:hypothetical protein
MTRKPVMMQECWIMTFKSCAMMSVDTTNVNREDEKEDYFGEAHMAKIVWGYYL